MGRRLLTEPPLVRLFVSFLRTYRSWVLTEGDYWARARTNPRTHSAMSDGIRMGVWVMELDNSELS